MHSKNIVIISIILALCITGTAFCEEVKPSQSDRKKLLSEAGKLMNSDKEVLDFYKKRNVLAGKMMLGLSNEKIEQKGPAGIRVNVLNPKTSAEEFFLSIDKAGYYSDQFNLAEGFFPKKKSR